MESGKLVPPPPPPGFDTPVSVSSMVTLSASCTFQSRGQETDVELSFSRFLHQSSNFVSVPIQKRTLRLLSRGCSRRNWLLNFPEVSTSDDDRNLGWDQKFSYGWVESSYKEARNTVTEVYEPRISEKE